jgi:hypothetical protein
MASKDTMTATLWAAATILVADAGLILVLLLLRIPTPLESGSIGEIAPLLVLAGVLTAVLAFLFNLRRGRSEDVLEAVSGLFEKAHEALLTKEGTLTNHRHAWLSAARLIATAETLSKQIAELSHQTIYKEEKEYWRGRLYDWSGRVRDPLAEKSLALLYRFIQWPQERPDPMRMSQVSRMKRSSECGHLGLVVLAFSWNKRFEYARALKATLGARFTTSLA